MVETIMPKMPNDDKVTEHDDMQPLYKCKQCNHYTTVTKWMAIYYKQLCEPCFYQMYPANQNP